MLQAFKRLFSKTTSASSTIVTKQYSADFETRTFNFSNTFVKIMNASNPQETGRIMEYIISDLFARQSKHVHYVQYVQYVSSNNYSNAVVNILLQNNYEYRLFVSQMNKLVLFLLNWSLLMPIIPVTLQDDLTFKKISCCKVKTCKCFADVTTIDTIIELKTVRSSFFYIKPINSEISVKKLNNIGIRYYNQLMMYACGFNRKYGKWPKRLILLNAYTGEIIDWKPSVSTYNEFFDLI